jgi:hypothetical protein
VVSVRRFNGGTRDRERWKIRCCLRAEVNEHRRSFLDIDLSDFRWFHEHPRTLLALGVGSSGHHFGADHSHLHRGTGTAWKHRRVGTSFTFWPVLEVSKTGMRIQAVAAIASENHAIRIGPASARAPGAVTLLLRKPAQIVGYIESAVLADEDRRAVGVPCSRFPPEA